MLKLVAAVAAAMMGLCAQAGAAVYTFTPSFTSDPGPFYSSDNLSFSIGINDAAVRSGSFFYAVGYKFDQISNSFVSSATGDVQNLQFFRNTSRGVSLSSGSSVDAFTEDYFNVSLSFDASGHVTAGDVNYSTDTYYVFINRTNQTFTGKSGFGSLSAANVVGQLTGGLSTSVPEPPALVLLGASLVGIFAWRRASPYTVAAMSNAER